MEAFETMTRLARFLVYSASAVLSLLFLLWVFGNLALFLGWIT